MKQTITQNEKKPRRRWHSLQRGQWVAQLVCDAWRAGPLSDSVSLSEAELTELNPLLLESGPGALAWTRIRETALANTPAGQTLHDVYRQFRLSALRHEREIAYVLSLLRAEGIEPVLVKGWSIARRYPDPALRPYGDIDLCIRPDQFTRATAALKCLESIKGHFVDLHCGFEEVGRSRRNQAGKQKSASIVWDELFSRSQSVPLTVDSELSSVRILSDEDHLRILCRHLLRSGARRPTWLCDVAVLLSSKSNVQRPKPSPGKQTLDSTKPFDWDICLGRNPIDANWIATAVVLAHELVGVDISQTPFANYHLPRWVAPAVLCEWGESRVPDSMSNVKTLSTERRLWTLDFGLWTLLYRRWNNPLRATAAAGGRFNDWPRLPYRVAELLLRLQEVPEKLSFLVHQIARKNSAPRKVSRPAAIARSHDALVGQ